MEWSKIPGFLWLLNVLKRVEADYSQPCLGLLAVFSGWCFTVSLRWWSNSQNHRWLRLAETVGVHLVHTSAQVGPPKACCPCPDGFWISLQMQTLQPPKQTVLLLSHSHSGKKKRISWHSYRNSHVPICAIASGPASCGGSWKNKTKTSVLLSVSISLYVHTCMQIKSLVIHFIHDFPCQLPWNKLDLTVRPRYINWTSDQFLCLESFSAIWTTLEDPLCSSL